MHLFPGCLIYFLIIHWIKLQKCVLGKTLKDHIIMWDGRLLKTSYNIRNVSDLLTI